MRVGIDLGTTYSLIAKLDGNGTPVLLPDLHEKDNFHTPSTVSITSDGAFVGQMAEALNTQEPTIKSIRFFKRRFGDDRVIFFDPNGQGWFPETIAALVLKKLKFDAEAATSSELESAVITVPAHFNDRQRKAVLAGAALADIPVLGLVEEPVAAALHYGVCSGHHDQVILVYDLGGGTFDVSILTINDKGIYVLGKDGLTELGGKEFDEQLSHIVLEQFEHTNGHPPDLNASTLLQLKHVSEELKIELCMPGQKTVRRLILLGSEAVEVKLSRRDFDNAITSLVEQTEEVTLRCISNVGFKPKDVNALLLVGGSSMIPLIRDRMQKIFDDPQQKLMFHEPTKAVAYGAAMHAAQLSGEAERYEIPAVFRGVSGYNVGIHAVDPRTRKTIIDTVIKKNMNLPVRTKKTYYTTRPNQQKMHLELVQFLDENSELIKLGQLIIGPLPSPRQNYPIEVTVENLENGTIQINAYDPQSKVELSKSFGSDSKEGMAHLADQRTLVQSTFFNNTL